MSQDLQIGRLFGGDDVSTFFGLPGCEDLEKLDAGIALICASGATPYETVGPYCSSAPAALRKASADAAANFARYNFDIGGPVFADGRINAVDCGDLAYDADNFSANRDTIRGAIGQILDANAVPILIGGDDSVPIPMLQAYEGRGPLTILQIDAHIDWRQDHLGETLGLSSTMRRASEMGHFDRIVQVGARGTGSAWPGDVEDALSWGAHLITAEQLHRQGLEAALDLIPEGSDIVVSLDVDAFDPAIVPGVLARTPGGLDYFQVLGLIRGASERGRIRGVNIIEFVPEVDIDGLGANTVVRLMAGMIGLIARQ